MSFTAYTFLITYFMAALGVFAVSLVEAVEPVFLLFAGAGILISLALNVKRKELVPAYLWNVLAIIVLVSFIADYTAFSRSLIVSASRFLTVLLALKLFDLRKNRDYLIVFAIVFFQILAAAASTVSPLFFVILSLFIIGGIWAMIIFNIKKDWAEGVPRAGEVPAGVFSARFFASIALLSTASLVMTFLLFMILPRMGFGFFQSKTLNTVKVTGFSDSVDLGSIGPVKKDPSIVMRVEAKGLKKGDFLYFRGSSLDRYDGWSWSKSIKKRTPLRNLAPGLYSAGKAGGRLIEQRIMLEPLETDVVFAASYPVTVEGRFTNLWTDDTGSIYMPAVPYSKVEYRAWSSDTRTDELEHGVSRYLDTSFIDRAKTGARIRSLAYTLTKGKNGDIEKAAAIEAHLRSSYAYTLDPAKGAEETPIEDFLFSSRQGYCEHYATAMVLLLRASGVPARIVTGFLQGEWNGLGQYFIVRQQDAHSWVEAYIKGSGWVKFDPTPSAGLASAFRPSPLTLYLDLLKWRWDRYVIQFSLADQIKISRTIEGNFSGAITGLMRAFKSPRAEPAASRALYAVIAVIALLIIIVTAIRLLRRSVSWRGKTPLFYIEMLKALKKKGYARKRQETPLEFARRTGSSDALYITKVFHDERYGGKEISEEARTGVKAALEGIKKSA